MCQALRIVRIHRMGPDPVATGMMGSWALEDKRIDRHMFMLDPKNDWLYTNKKAEDSEPWPTLVGQLVRNNDVTMT